MLANYFKSNQLLKTGSEEEALKYLKTSAEYSADLTDMNNYRGYYTEAKHLMEAGPHYIYTSYIKQLKKNPSNNDEVLKALSQMAFRNPTGFKEQLRTFYAQNYSTNGDFGAFWQKQLNSQLLKAPAFKIKGLDGTKYSSEVPTGKWKLMDFWGTWCGPCREEHPALEKMYTGRAESFFNNVDLITIACLDEEENVSNYQKLFRYTFPVAMSDLKIEKQFNVTTYPTKILISPEGNALTIPFGMDWVNYIKQYVSN
jgi:thiol-disulfide isomerase/thioredoxin